MKGVTWNKAAIGGIAAPIVDWLVTLADQRLIACCQTDMPTTVEAALSMLIVGAVIYYIPNAEVKP